MITLGRGPLQAGALDQMVQLQSSIETFNELHEPVRTWTTQETVHAQVDIVRGSNVFLANQYQEPTALVVRIRRGPAITKKWRILWEDGLTGRTRTLNVQDILPLDTRDGLDLPCSEGIE